MKDIASKKITIYRFFVLILLLFSYIPLTLLTGTGAGASSLSNVESDGQTILKNCRIISSNPPGDKLFLQEALPTLEFKIDKVTYNITGSCSASFTDNLDKETTVKTSFAAEGKALPNDVTSAMQMEGTFTLDAEYITIGINKNAHAKLSGSFKSSEISPATVKSGAKVRMHFSGKTTVSNNLSNEDKPEVSFDADFDQLKFDWWGAQSPYSEASSAPTGLPTKNDQAPGLGHCFIATAAYGSPTAPQLDILRAFRDGVLMKSDAGMWFVKTYYYLSPPLADFIADKDWLRAIVRFELLDPIVFILNNSQQVWNN